MKTSIRTLGRFVLATLLLAGTSLAQAWPERAIKIVVPAPPGGNMDGPARVFAQFLSKELGQPAIVENKPGAGGAIGVQAMLNAPADGYTLLYSSSNVFTEIPYAMKPPYDPMKDVLPVAALTKYRYVLVVASGYPANDLADMARQLKAAPDKNSFASPSPGTVAHFGGEILNRKLGVNMQHIPYYGTPPALTAVMSGEVTMLLDSVVTSSPQHKAADSRRWPSPAPPATTACPRFRPSPNRVSQSSMNSPAGRAFWCPRKCRPTSSRKSTLLRTV